MLISADRINGRYATHVGIVLGFRNVPVLGLESDKMEIEDHFNPYSDYVSMLDGKGTDRPVSDLDVLQDD